MSETVCRHCGDRIVKTRFLDRDTWTHQPAGAAFMDGQLSPRYDLPIALSSFEVPHV